MSDFSLLKGLQQELIDTLEKKKENKKLCRKGLL